MAITEIRTYEIFDGKMDDWVKLMTDVIVPFQTEIGMKITGMYRGETNDNLFIWTRDFDSEEQRLEQYEKVYQSAKWKEEITPEISKVLNRETMLVQRVVKV